MTSLPQTHLTAVVENLGPNAAIQIRESVVPDASSLSPGECLLQMECSSVCHSDLGIKNNDYPALCALAKLPLIGGHEGVGRIVAIAAHTTNPVFSIGQRVGVKWIASSCLSCDACRKGSEWLCPQSKLSGLTVSGTFQQYVVAYLNGVVPIPDGVSSEMACPILCAGVTVYKALKQCNASMGDWVAIPGAGGGLGHLAVQYANAMGLRVIAIDTGSDKESLCKGLGVEAWIDFKNTPDIVSAVVEAAGGRGPKAAIIAAAVPAPYAEAMSYLAPEGTLVAVGLPPNAKLELDILLLVGKTQRVQGSYVGNRQDVVEALTMVASGRVQPHFVVQTLRDLPEVYEKMKKGQLTGRVVLDLRN